MPVQTTITFDCADPHAQARFWAAVMDWVVEDHSVLVEGLLGAGAVPEEAVTRVEGRLAWREAAGLRDPAGGVDPRTGTGLGGRMLFQTVPEGKSAKNRVHLDVHVEAGQRDAHVDRLVALGASRLWEKDEWGSSWVTLTDPEGNEFCVA